MPEVLAINGIQVCRAFCCTLHLGKAIKMWSVFHIPFAKNQNTFKNSYMSFRLTSVHLLDNEQIASNWSISPYKAIIWCKFRHKCCWPTVGKCQPKNCSQHNYLSGENDLNVQDNWQSNVASDLSIGQVDINHRFRIIFYWKLDSVNFIIVSLDFY